MATPFMSRPSLSRDRPFLPTTFTQSIPLSLHHTSKEMALCSKSAVRASATSRR
jgi:hypothetical protein